MKEPFSLLWEGVVLGEECGESIPISSKRQLRQFALGVSNNPEVTKFVLWDREGGSVSYTVDPIEWEDKPTGFEEEWAAVL